MKTEVNKAVVRRLFTEVLEQRNEAAIGEIFHADVLGHDATSRAPKRGIESVTSVFQMFLHAFPNGRFPVYDMIAEQDKVVVRWGLIGSHEAPFLGIPASGRPVDVDGIIIYRLENQKIVEYWGKFDTMRLMEQLNTEPAGADSQQGGS